MSEIGPYTDLDYYEDQKTVRDMERSIESSNALLKRLRQSIESDQYLLDHARRRIAEHPEFSDVSGEKVPAPFVLDNEPACGAPKGWRWGYLPCGCRNDGYGNHLNDSRSRLAKADAHAAHFGGGDA